jgi:hypothetical protein
VSPLELPVPPLEDDPLEDDPPDDEPPDDEPPDDEPPVPVPPSSPLSDDNITSVRGRLTQLLPPACAAANTTTQASLEHLMRVTTGLKAYRRWS